MKYRNLLVIALVIIRRTHKAHKTDSGAENPTGPNLPDFTLPPASALASALAKSLTKFFM